MHARQRDLGPAELQVNYAEYEGKISILEPLVGRAGWLQLSLFTVASLDYTEDHLLFATVTDLGETLDDEVGQRLLTLPFAINSISEPPDEVRRTLDSISRVREEEVQKLIAYRNARFFEAEAEKLEGWADDLKLGLEREIKDIDRLIKEARRAATAALTLEEKLAGQKQIKSLESLRSQKRRNLFDAQDDVEAQRDRFIQSLEAKLTQQTSGKVLFCVRWSLN
jgi:adenine-specific DNA-methyltransferase